MARLSLDQETWGDRFHRAYRLARSQYGGRTATGVHAFSYETVARRLNDAGIAMTDQLLQRLERQEGQRPPTQMRTRQIAYFALVAFGFDPADFGLTDENVALNAYDVPKIRRMIEPKAPAKPGKGRTGPTNNSRSTHKRPARTARGLPAQSTIRTRRRAA